MAGTEGKAAGVLPRTDFDSEEGSRRRRVGRNQQEAPKETALHQVWRKKRRRNNSVCVPQKESTWMNTWNEEPDHTKGRA